MELKRLFRGAAYLAAICSLHGCSIGYDVDVTLQGDKVIFKFTSDWIDGHKPAPVQQLSVRELSRNPHTVWKIESIDYNGRKVGELAYGAVPSGMKQTIPAQPLKIGQYYRVDLLALGGGGYQEFVISPEPENGQLNDIKIVRPAA